MLHVQGGIKAPERETERAMQKTSASKKERRMTSGFDLVNSESKLTIKWSSSSNSNELTETRVYRIALQVIKCNQ